MPQTEEYNSPKVNPRLARISDDRIRLCKSNADFNTIYLRLFDFKEYLGQTLRTSTEDEDAPEFINGYHLFLEIIERLKILRKTLECDAKNFASNMGVLDAALTESDDPTGDSLTDDVYNKVERSIEKARKAYDCVHEQARSLLQYIKEHCRPHDTQFFDL